jgi:hypothetical protein
MEAVLIMLDFEFLKLDDDDILFHTHHAIRAFDHDLRQVRELRTAAEAAGLADHPATGEITRFENTLEELLTKLRELPERQLSTVRLASGVTYRIRKLINYITWFSDRISLPDNPIENHLLAELKSGLEFLERPGFLPVKPGADFLNTFSRISGISEASNEALDFLRQQVLLLISQMQASDGGDTPHKPQKGAPHDEWFRWYHTVIDEGRCNINLKELAAEMGLTYNYVRQLHSAYKAEFRTEN